MELDDHCPGLQRVEENALIREIDWWRRGSVSGYENPCSQSVQTPSAVPRAQRFGPPTTSESYFFSRFTSSEGPRRLSRRAESCNRLSSIEQNLEPRLIRREE